MAEPEDLLGKADALMARHRPGRTGIESYPEIPVLDEVADLPPESGDLPVLTELVEPDLVEPELVEPDLLPEEHPEALAASLRASVLARMQPEIDAMIEERLKHDLAPIVDRLIDELRGDLQLIAREILGDAIDTALEQKPERRESGD